MNRMINEHSITTKEKEKNKKREKWCSSACILMGITQQLETFTHVKSNHGEKKTVNSREGLFFSINNSFWHIGEEVKLDIPEEHSLQRRMTRNNEEILPQTLSPAEWRHKSTKKKNKKLLNFWFIKGNNFPLYFSINIYCKAALRITYKTLLKQ